MLINTTVTIKAPPSAPTIIQKGAAVHAVNGNNSGVLLNSGSMTVQLRPGEGTSKILVHQRGMNTAGEPFADIVAVLSVAPNVTTFNVSYNSLNLSAVRSDSIHYISVQSENDQGERLHSNSVSFMASVRESAPTLLTSRSLENLQVTLTGTVSVPSTTALFSVLASSGGDNAFYQTNAVNVPLTPSSSSTFMSVVTTFKGNNLVSGTVYRLAVIQHVSPFTVSNIEVPVDPNLAIVPLTQSHLSNVLTAITVAYLPSSVQWNTSSQTFPTIDGKLMFSPSIVNSVLIPAGMNLFFDFKVNGVPVPQGVISNDTNKYSVPHQSYYTVNPTPKAIYDLSVKFDYPLSTSQYNAIVGTPALNIYTDPSTQFKYANVKQFANSVTQNPSKTDLPLVKDFTIQTSIIGSTQCLAGSWLAPYSNKMTELKLKVKRYELQAIKGVAGNPNGFDSGSLLSIDANGNKTLSVEATLPSNGGSSDATEFTLLKFYNGGAVSNVEEGYYSVRIRHVATGDSGDIDSDWVPLNYQVVEKAMSAPSSVTVSSALTPASSNGNSVNISYSSVATASITGLPANWSSAKAIASKISLFDQHGNIVSGPITKSFTQAEIAAAPAGAYTSSAIISGLENGITVYARVNMVYARVSASGEQMSDVKDGAIVQPAPYSIKSNVYITAAKFTQAPVSTSARGLDANGGNSFSIETDIDVGNNDPNSLVIKYVVPASIGGNTTHIHDAIYDASKKRWNLTLTPVTQYDYAANKVTILAISPQNVDAQSF